jgi:hypothetical protein
MESALGMASTQGCGPMSAQFGSDVKRMQHGFAAQDGRLTILMGETDYIGRQNVFEEPDGGFLLIFEYSVRDRRTWWINLPMAVEKSGILIISGSNCIPP